MIRADESGKGRDFTIVAVLIGLAWAAHPSATTLGAAFLLFVVAHRKALGGKGIAGRTGIAAACAIGPSLLLPLLALREPVTMFGHPTSLGEWIRSLLGGAFTHRPGTFGFESWRALNAMKYLWEEFLLIGLVLALVGLSRIATVNRKLLLGIGAWVLPSALVATLFKIEGQQDLWLVAAWLPLHLAVAGGLASIPPRFARIATISLGMAGIGWAIAANGRAVSMRGVALAEQFGRFHLENLEPDAILLLDSDDALATTRYLQIVRGLRRDVRVIDAARIGSGWYDTHLAKLDPRLKPGSNLRSFAEANVSKSVPVYFEAAPADLPGLAPRGPLMRLAAEGEPNEPRLWDFPLTAKAVRGGYGRERGIRLRILPDRLVVEPEPYERRWVAAIVRGEVQQAQFLIKQGGLSENFRRAAALLESAREAEPDRPSLEILHLLGICYYVLNDYDRAEPLLKQSLHLGPTPRQAVRALTYLSTICRRQGRAAEAARYQEQAMAVVRSDPELRGEFEQFPRPKDR
jgi:tetratricopeptide (TPR) repeat protein